MYVCCCNAVTDGQIRLAIELDEIQTLNELNDKFGLGRHCGKCLEEVRDIFNNSSKIKSNSLLFDELAESKQKVKKMW